MNGDEGNIGGSGVGGPLFKKRTKARAIPVREQQSSRSGQRVGTAYNDDVKEEEDEEQEFGLVRRSAKTSTRGRATLTATGGSGPRRQTSFTPKLAIRTEDDVQSAVDHLDSEVHEKFKLDDSIPTQAVIDAAKEKRRRAAAAAATAEANGSEDFISLSGEITSYARDPHPESRLQREDDQTGSGEEEFAEFTGATERVAIEQNAILKERQAERQARKEELEAAQEEQDDDTSNESDREWERAQLDRAGNYNTGVSMTREQRKKRSQVDVKPYRPAPIPRSAPLPSITSTSARLEQRLKAYQEALTAQEALHEDAMSKLTQLEQDEQRNKEQLESAAEREAWFREFNEFITSMALFLEQKMPLLDNVELEWNGHLAVRARIVQRARADALTDRLALFYGVPASSLLQGVHLHASDGAQNDDPLHDGDGLSETRVTRRQQYPSLTSFDRLLPTDQAAFDVAQRDIKLRAEQIMDDVQAAEYREPAARVESEGNTLHPASLVARFQRWRTLYAQEYNEAWGGLTLASMWDFWIRRLLCGWDACRMDEQKPNSLDQFSWYGSLSHYAETGNGGDDGGDAEAMQHAFTNTVLPTLSKMGEQGAFDPWNKRDNANMLELAEQISYIVEKDNEPFQAFVQALLDSFARHINAFIKAFTLPVVLSAPAMSPDGPQALLEVMQYVYETLLCHLISWHRFARQEQRELLASLASSFVEVVLLALFDMSAYVVNGAQLVQKLSADLLARTARPALLSDQIRIRLNQMAEKPI